MAILKIVSILVLINLIALEEKEKQTISTLFLCLIIIGGAASGIEVVLITACVIAIIGSCLAMITLTSQLEESFKKYVLTQNDTHLLARGLELQFEKFEDMSTCSKHGPRPIVYLAVTERRRPNATYNSFV